ncbi:SpaA isopeptide-forming pilin-related protein [Lactiplantibacillus plantarum]|uniref:SpaA isopeptide-forming pilin-related protein n=1 Tax=Lactiplantibacillus plantarum TaxID=1590 RepID=UPI001075D33B|nr:SpaA isopeptide-forming pilin-related protein [Lactiplantibacillus plantarum]TFZ26389.1 hypothetical protein E2P76_08645 [Lactiplantibacillus plantarum]
MRVKLFSVLLGLLTVLATVLVLGRTVKAAVIPATGLTGGAAVITDRDGKVVTETSTLSKWSDYTVKYDWSVRDGQPIAAGDTATVDLPAGTVAPVDLSFPLKNDNGRVVGIFTIKAGETSGEITFNDTLAQTGTNRAGTLQFYVKGTADSDVHFDWKLNKIGWIGSYDDHGLPANLTWNIAFNPTGQNIGTVVVNDTLGPNQSYLPGSVVAQTGSYNNAGNFVQSGTIVPQVVVNGNQLTFTFSNVTTAVNMVYNSKLTKVNEGSNDWINSASMNGTTVSGNVSYGGNGTGHGDNQLGSVTLTKRDSTTKAVLRGAEYQLRDSTGEVIESGLTTNENGDINITDLIPGQYQFVETKAPVGYTLNSTPINFKIDADTVATPVEVTQFDETAVVTGSVVLTKVAANSGQTLAGAIYNLKDGAGQTIRHGLKTDTRGQIRVDELVPSRYQFIETKAPAGYALNQTPLDFTIVEGQTAAVTVKATDQLVQPIKPEQPGATKPVKPSPIKPEQPGDTESAQPSPTKPKQPGTTKPAEPSTSEPKQPSSTKPAESSTTIPEQSSTNTSQITGLNNGTTDSNVTVPNGQDSVGSTGNGSLAVAADQSGQVSKAVTLPQTSENHQSLLIAILGLALLLLMLVWLPAK